jgi:alkylation response protein AidB-like acyl-CoA dehydrogenase
VTFFGPVPDWVEPLVSQARSGGEDISAAVSTARRYGVRLPLPGRDTRTRWSVLAAVAAVDLTPARVLEAHTDALAILGEAGDPLPDDLAFGVFAAEAPDARLDASLAADGHGAVLTGTKPWCSVAADLDAALVTAHTPEGRQLFRVDLREPTVEVEKPERWVARGLRTVTSTSVTFDATPATAVGPAGWYLIRSGFAWGGMGVAACWFGAASALLDTVRRRAAARGGELDLMHLGAADIAVHGARCALSDAADQIDAGHAGQHDGETLALRVRSVVADAVEQVLRCAAHALGPTPLVFDAEHAARVADLEVYVRQHHAERDLVTLGRLLVEHPEQAE